MQQNWTVEKLALLKELWGKGNTAAAIARQLGVSKSAVLGKIFRLRLPPAEKPLPDADFSPAHRRKGRRFKTPEEPTTKKSEEPAVKRGKSLLELTNETCRWPIGDPSKKNFHFCGEPGADLEQGIPYCERHRRRAYNSCDAREGLSEDISFAARDKEHRFSSTVETSLQRLFRVAIAKRART
jgi:GcrA cell cycle regulator